MITKFTSQSNDIIISKLKSNFLFLFLLLFFSGTLKAQLENENDSLCSFNLKFVDYLINKSEYDNALFVLKDTLFNCSCNNFKDEFYYLKGWAYYYKKELDSSSYYLEKVSSMSNFYLKSYFYNFYNSAHLGNYSKAEILIGNQKDTNDLFIQLANFQNAGLYLLKRDFKSFERCAGNFRNDYYYFELQQQELLKLQNSILNTKQKSKLMAAGLSAVIPGLGKIYGNKLGEGIAAFTTVGGFAAITIESYLKFGYKDIRTIAFGSLFSLFYIGNIYGSMITIQQNNNEIIQSQNLTILYHMHIPLRTIFD